MKDFQRSLVYSWENTLERGEYIDYENIQEYVDYIWTEMGLKFPPKVNKVPKNATTICADATRISVRFREQECKRIILHELAHSMTMGIDGKGHQHNDVFVGMYMTLMEKFMNFSIFLLWASAEKFGVQYTKFEKPRILDNNEIYE